MTGGPNTEPNRRGPPGRVTVNAWKAAAAAYKVAKTLGDARDPLRAFYNYHAREIDSVFQELGQGGTYRGLTWAGWSPSSLGRARKSGRRADASSRLLQDTGRARQDATTGVLVLTKDRLMYGPSVFYGEEIYATRSPYSLTSADRQKLLDLFRSAADAAIGGRR